jgi:hypothetical protein
MSDRLAQIEAMLKKGMTEEQIIAALGGKVPAPAAPAAAPSPTDALKKATGIGPAPERMPPLARNILSFFTGVTDPLDIPEGMGSLPLPFTEKRLLPADAVTGAMGGAELAKLPGFIRGLLGRRGEFARSANAWANQQYPTRTLSPNRMLPPGPGLRPDIPLNSIDNELVSLAPDPIGGYNFMPQETVETAIYGTLNPGGGRIISTIGKGVTEAAKKAAKKPR